MVAGDAGRHVFLSSRQHYVLAIECTVHAGNLSIASLDLRLFGIVTSRDDKVFGLR